MHGNSSDLNKCGIIVNGQLESKMSPLTSDGVIGCSECCEGVDIPQENSSVESRARNLFTVTRVRQRFHIVLHTVRLRLVSQTNQLSFPKVWMEIIQYDEYSMIFESADLVCA